MATKKTIGLLVVEVVFRKKESLMKEYISFANRADFSKVVAEIKECLYNCDKVVKDKIAAKTFDSITSKEDIEEMRADYFSVQEELREKILKLGTMVVDSECLDKKESINYLYNKLNDFSESMQNTNGILENFRIDIAVVKSTHIA